MFCPICDTQHDKNKSCPECGFKNNNQEIARETDKTNWKNDVVLPYRAQYWQQLTHFEFEGTTLKKYKGKNKRVDSVKIPYGVEKIGKRDFQGVQFVKFIDMPNTVKEIDDEVFDSCTRLQYVNLSSNLRTIGIRAFSFCTGLEMIKLPKSVEHIKKEAFANCWDLLVVITPKDIKMGKDVYYNCSCVKINYP